MSETLPTNPTTRKIAIAELAIKQKLETLQTKIEELENEIKQTKNELYEHLNAEHGFNDLTNDSTSECE